jgi:glycosyltransferase involved in cell wall biosynthesis
MRKITERTQDPLVYIQYIPHGINPTKFFKVEEETDEYVDFRKEVLGEDKFDFIFFYNSRNIRRKSTSDLMLAFHNFVEDLPEAEKKRVALLMHTELSHEAGTDLPAVIRDVIPNVSDQIIFTNKKLEQHQLNYLYNMVDVTVNVSSNEGFGLSIAESLMTETPVILNVTGGLQDQAGFMDENGDYLDPDTHFTYDWGSNHDGRYTDCGEWVVPIFPASRSLVGSPVTPYIFDDRCKFEDITDAMRTWYDTTPEERERKGALGREFCMGPGGLNSENMCNLFIDHMNIAMDKFTPRQKFIMEKV